MDLSDQIYKRKSCRKYLDDEIDMSAIKEFMDNVKPLDSKINYSYEDFWSNTEYRLTTR